MKNQQSAKSSLMKILVPQDWERKPFEYFKLAIFNILHYIVFRQRLHNYHVNFGTNAKKMMLKKCENLI